MTRTNKSSFFEHRKEPLLPRAEFYKRQILFMLYATLIIVISLGIGMVGYHACTSLTWTACFLNAAMILSGMGPVDLMDSDGAKLFSGFYAIYSGVVFVSTIAVMFAPLGHRLMHSMHLEGDDTK